MTDRPGVPARELSDEELERQGVHAHAMRHWVFLHGTADQFRTHTERMLELEQALHAQLAVADCCLLDGDQTQAAALAAAAAPLLDRRLPFHARAELRHAELRARLEPDRAELLLALARHRRSPKYQALALARLGRREEAVGVALPTGSNLLLAEVAPPEQARAALDRVTRALPAELRTGFAGRGRLARQLVARA